jgi:hypothetical protein
MKITIFKNWEISYWVSYKFRLDIAWIYDISDEEYNSILKWEAKFENIEIDGEYKRTLVDYPAIEEPVVEEGSNDQPVNEETVPEQ